MKTKKYILILAILCLAVVQSSAQKDETKKYEFGINGFYGLSGLSGSVNNGSITSGLGYKLSIDGEYFFASHIGLGIGTCYATYTSKADLNSYTSNAPAIDDEGGSFEYRVKASGIKEKLNLTAIEVPVFIAYRKVLSRKIRLQSHVGLKASIPIEATYQCTNGVTETKGYYISNNVEFANMPNHGFQTIDRINYSGNLSTTIAYSIFGNVGITIPMGVIGLNLGVYGSYGLNSILKPRSSFLIDYPDNYNSLSSLSGKVSLISGGIRVGINFPCRSAKIKAARIKTSHGGKR